MKTDIIKRTLNMPPHIECYIQLVFDFKMWYNKTHLDKLYLYNQNLYGKDKEFKIWLKIARGINDLDRYLQDKIKNFNISKYYKSKAKYNNNYSYEKSVRTT